MQARTCMYTCVGVGVCMRQNSLTPHPHSQHFLGFFVDFFVFLNGRGVGLGLGLGLAVRQMQARTCVYTYVYVCACMFMYVGVRMRHRQ